jgi:hypothetical protein
VINKHSFINQGIQPFCEGGNYTLLQSVPLQVNKILRMEHTEVRVHMRTVFTESSNAHPGQVTGLHLNLFQFV